MSILKYLEKKKLETTNLLDVETNKKLPEKFKRSIFKQIISNFEEIKSLYSTDQEVDSITCMDQLNDCFIFGSSSGDVKILKLDQFNHKEVQNLKFKKNLSCIKFQNDEKFLVSSSIQSFISQFDIHSKLSTTNFKLSSDVFDFKIFQDTIYCACRDGSIQIIDTKKKSSKNPKIQSQGSINSILVDSTGQILISGSDKGFISIFDVRFPSKIVKTFDITNLQQVSLQRNRFTMKERVVSRKSNSNDIIIPKNNELQKFDFSEIPSKERDMLQYFSLKKQNVNNIQSLINHPYNDHLITFQLLNLTVGLLDIQKGRILKMYQNDKVVSYNNIQNHYYIKRKPCYYSNNFGFGLCAPIGNELVVLDWSNETEDLLFEIRDQKETKITISNDESKMLIHKIPLSGHPSCIMATNFSNLICGTGNNNICIIGEKEK